MSNRYRFDSEQLLEMLHTLLKGLQRLVVFHVPDMMTEEGIVFIRDAESVFQFRTRCKQGWDVEWKFDWEGRVTARTTDGLSNW